MVTVAGGFDGKVRTFNVGAAASLVVAAASGRVLMVGGEAVPPKFGRTVFDSLEGLGVGAPQTIGEAERSLRDSGFAATSPRALLAGASRHAAASEGRWSAGPRSTS